MQAKYYTKTITINILKALAATTSIAIAATSPYLIRNIVNSYKYFHLPKNPNQCSKKKISDTFTYLQKRNYISITHTKGQIYISLTPSGKKKAKQYQIDDLEIKHQKKWDKKWRILIFDIPENSRIKREALRGKLKQLGFQILQRSVWIYPYPCTNELKLLKKFFGFSENNYLLIESNNIGKLTKKYKRKFNLT